MAAIPTHALSKSKLSGLDHLRISLFWFGFNFVWGGFFGPLLAGQMTQLSPLHAAATIGWLSTIAAIPAILVPLLTGPFSDRCRSRFGRRSPFILTGSLIGVAGLLLMAASYAARNLAGYIACYLLLQIGTNIALAAYSGVIPDQVPIEERGRASGMMAVMSQVGTLAGIITCAIVLKGQVWCQFAMAGVLGLFGLVTVWTLRDRPIQGEATPLDWPTYFRSLWIDPRRYPDFAWVWLTRALMMLGFYMIQPYILYYLRDVIHVAEAEETAGKVLFLILVAATLSGYYGGRLSDRIGRKRLVTLSTLLIASMCVVFVFLNSLVQVLIAGVVFGIGYGAYISVDWALGTDVLPNKEEAAADMAVWHIAMTLPQMFSAYVAGTLILDHMIAGHYVAPDGQRVATYSHAGYGAVFSLAAVLFFMSGVLVRKVKGST
ncbi:MAG TPA: MFS transporter [Fimbriimonadaceae bacterium]|nr:MFS transporter [Fimbriimonadaceae bacterium]